MENWVRVSLITQLGSIISECESMIRKLERGENPGLGGSLQNIWSIFLALGQLEKEQK